MTLLKITRKEATISEVQMTLRKRAAGVPKGSAQPSKVMTPVNRLMRNACHANSSQKFPPLQSLSPKAIALVLSVHHRHMAKSQSRAREEV